jgi:hypothetical protein
MSVTVRYRPVPGRVQPYLSIWLALDPQPAALVGFVRRDTDTDRWVATARGDRHDICVGFSDRAGAAKWLLIAGVGGFKPAPAAEMAVAA